MLNYENWYKLLHWNEYAKFMKQKLLLGFKNRKLKLHLKDNS